MKVSKRFWVIVEVVEKRIYTNPVRVSPSIRIDNYLTFLDKVDIKRCTFSKKKHADRKLAKLKKMFMTQNLQNKGYKGRLLIESDEEYEAYLIDLFTRHWQVKEISLSVNLEDL